MKQNERQAIWRRLAITFADTQSAVVAVPVRVNQVEVAGALWKMRLLRLERPDPTRAHASWSCLEVA